MCSDSIKVIGLVFVFLLSSCEDALDTGFYRDLQFWIIVNEWSAEHRGAVYFGLDSIGNPHCVNLSWDGSQSGVLEFLEKGDTLEHVQKFYRASKLIFERTILMLANLMKETALCLVCS